ncbi:putative bifunctional diguanylate cyclase/phosphodiesterase [Marinobacter changyiensis]|uniref:putative bifunctional diguanylate cyclase/phosphodiesterase n=1 Tax=Marinobacter changyiensis TaxID=2604091 RepID=UPI0015D174DD|nr:EAL domain-containing protein [Marinobacter changyiensis]
MNIGDEHIRLRELSSLDILDTAREERFDRHTRLVAKIFDMPTVIISLVDADRQWFKSGVGCEIRQTSREESICSEALNLGFLEIPDTFKDAFFRNHPGVKGEPPLRFYAGAVLFGPTGQPLGTLCLNDTVPRRLTATERSLLKDFAQLVQHEMNRDVAHEKNRRSILDATLRDPTTGLPGEALLNDTLENLIRMSQDEERYLAIIHLWVDNLDMIGQLYGEAARNAVVRTIADRLTALDERILAAARVSDDRFVLIMPVESGEASVDSARRVLTRVGEHVTFENRHLRPEISLGTSLYPVDGERADKLMSRARKAFNHGMSYHRIHFYNLKEEAKANRRLLIEDRLETALTENQLTLNYQPIFTADGSRVVSFEALARWNDEELGVVSPGEFVPIAERSARLSYLLTYYVLRMACAQAQTWRKRSNEEAVHIAVNVPAREFYRPGFVDAVLGVLRDVGLDPSRLILELTEEGMIQDIEQTIETMAKLSAAGLQFALDDFGTGYSSLSHLRRLPVDTLKIDKSFINDLATNRKELELVTGIIGIAHGRGLKVVAEGVESAEQQQLLIALGCDKIQGYLLGRPVSPDKIAGILDERSEDRGNHQLNTGDTNVSGPTVD